MKFQVPVGLDTLEAEKFPMGMLRALTLAFGEESQYTHGKPVTKLVKPIKSGDTIALVESTLAFPDKGAFFVGARRFTYKGKTDGSFVEVTPDIPMYYAVNYNQKVVCDVDAILPD
tara:strand:+ start:492 stop:839 length:348 start_codon:yes stop_codon:yes gene_type:complete